MAHVTAAEVNAFIPEDREVLATVDATMDAQQYGIVESKLNARYDTSTWVDATTTPQQVRTIVAMRIAGYIFLKAHAENVGNELDGYGEYLVSSAEALLGGLAEGTIDLDNVTPIVTGSGFSFWPTNLATTIAEEEGEDAEGAAFRAFSMGKVF